MANFNLYAPKIREFEGFICWDEGDSGGLTIWGLIYSSDKQWDGWKIILPFLNDLSPLAKLEVVFPEKNKRQAFKSSLFKQIEPFKEQLWQKAIPFYKQKYWDKIGGDNIQSQELAEEIVDEQINSGMGVKFAQKMVGLPETGILTSQLIDKLNNK